MAGELEDRTPLPFRATAVLGLLAATAPLSLDAYLPALPAIAAEFGASAQAVQLSLTACLLGLGLGQLIAGPLGDRFGRRRPMIIGAIVFSLASLGCAFAPSAGALVLLRLLQGLSGAVGIALSRAVVQDVATGRAAGRLYSQMAAVSGGAPVLAPVLGAVVIAAAGWRAVFLVLAALGAVMLVAVLVLLPETHPRERRVSAAFGLVVRSFRDLMRDRVFRGYQLTVMCSAGVLFSYISSAPFVFQIVLGFTQLQFALTFACVGLGLIGASLAAARLLRRMPATRVVRGALAVQLAGIGLLGCALVMRLAFSWDTPVLLLISLLFAVVPCGVVNPACTALAMGRSGGRAGSASALLGLGMFVAGALVSPLSGAGDPALIMVILMASAAVAALLASELASRAAHRRD